MVKFSGMAALLAATAIANVAFAGQPRELAPMAGGQHQGQAAQYHSLSGGEVAHHSAPHASASQSHSHAQSAQTFSSVGMTSPGFAMGEVPDARAGECYARIKIPAQYQNVAEEVIVREGHERTRVTKPQLGSTSRQVEIRPAHTTFKVIPPQYKARTEKVLVRPGYERLVVQPAQYTTVTETIPVSAPRLEWRPGKVQGAVRTHVDAHTGAVYCLVEVPGETRTITRTVLTQPEIVKPVAVPPEFRNITKYEVIPARVEEVQIAPQFATITTQDLIEPAQRITEKVPPQTQTIDKKVLISPERYEWVSVLCDTNADAATISRIQQSLAGLGLYKGAIDGILGPQTYAAIAAYQRSMGVNHSGYLSMDTVRGLLGGSVVESQSSYSYSQSHSNHHSDGHRGESYSVQSEYQAAPMVQGGHHLGHATQSVAASEGTVVAGLAYERRNTLNWMSRR
jgi:peptidoglycan hydrolase-like protein with peptidoglycan-binding domain